MKKILFILTFFVSFAAKSQVNIGSDGRVHSSSTGGTVTFTNELITGSDTTTAKNGLAWVNGTLYTYYGGKWNASSLQSAWDSTMAKKFIAWNYQPIGSYALQATTITINGTAYDLSTNRSWTINSMVYPSAGIAVSTGSAWGTSITDNSTNWNTVTGKVNYTDTSSMLSPYQRSAFAVKYSDTASMLSPYARSNSIPSLSGVVKYSDTSSMLSPYARQNQLNNSLWNTVTAKMDSARVKNWGNWTFQPLGSYLTSNQTITLSGVVTGLGTTAITTSIAAGAITNTMLANSAVANLSGTNTGDNAVNSLYSGLVSNATHTGDATGATVLTLATVNSNIGTFNNVTVNAKGLVTSASNTSYLTANQTITLSGDVSGSGATAITTAIGAGKVTNTMLAGSIAASKLVGTDITTVGTITSGTWNGSAIADSYISSASTWNGKQAAYTNLTSIGSLANASGWLKNNGTGTFSYSTPTKSDVGLGSVENTALSTWAGSGNITTVGTLSAGSIPYSLLSGTIPTWNQNTSGTAANATTWNGQSYGGVYSSGSISGNTNALLLNTTNLDFERVNSTTFATFLGLGSNAYTSTAYLPLAAGSGSPLSGDLFITNAGSHIYGGTTTTYSSIGNSNYGSYILINGATNATPNTVSIVTASGNAVTFNADHSSTFANSVTAANYYNVNGVYSSQGGSGFFNHYNNSSTLVSQLGDYGNEGLLKLWGSNGVPAVYLSGYYDNYVANNGQGFAIGTTSASGYKLYVSGTGYFTGYLTASGGAGTSDLRVKNVLDYDTKTSILPLLHLREYQFKDIDSLGFKKAGDEVRWGFATDDVKKQYPSLIRNLGSNTTTEALNYQDLTNMALIELRDGKADKNEVERLKQRISELEKHIK